MLPPLIFNSGYTMHRKKFFQNLGNISIFGLGTTIFCFVIYGMGSIAIVQTGVTMRNYTKDRNGEHTETPIDMSPLQTLLFAALLCSSDVVAAVSIVDYGQQPKLYSCVFGEGVMNDIISIILYGTVVSMLTTTFSAATPLVIIGQFVMLGVISLSIGLFFGFVTSFCFKRLGFLRINPIIETYTMFAFSLISYFVSNSIKISGMSMSGISSLLTCAIVQSHYTYYNLSPQGKTSSLFVVSFLGTAAEAAVYSYIGIALVSQIPLYWSFGFIFAEFFLIIAGRLIAIFSTFFLFRLCCKSRTLNLRELTFISYAGMIRGAIAFALVLTLPFVDPDTKLCSDPTLPPDSCFDKPTYEMLVSTTLILVILTTLCFGTFMSIVQKFLVSPSEEDLKEVERDMRSKSIAQETAMRSISVYEEITHPNEEADEENEDDGFQYDAAGNKIGWTGSWFYNWFAKFDESTLRPFFIRNYDPNIVILEDEYQEALKVKFDDDIDQDLAERVEMITRTKSVSQRLRSMSDARMINPKLSRSASTVAPKVNKKS